MEDKTFLINAITAVVFMFIRHYLLNYVYLNYFSLIYTVLWLIIKNIDFLC